MQALKTKNEMLDTSTFCL